MLKATWLGHSAFKLEDGKHTLLIDPFLTGNPMAAAKADEIAADFIVVTHGHGDHLGDSVAISKRTGAMIVSNFEIVNYCLAQGAKAHPLHIGGGHDFPFGRVQLTQALHGSSLPDGSYGGNPAGVLVRMGGKVVYHAGDTGLFGDMKLIGDRYHPDIAILPIGDNFTMGIDDAVYAVQLLKPKIVIPIHYNTFPVIAQDAESFKSRVTNDTSAQCKALAPGETITL